MLEENEDLHHNGVLTGTHVQEDSVFHAYTGVPYVPTPSPAPPPLHRLSPLPKVEEEEVDINVCRIMEDRIGWEQEDKVKGEELLYTEVMWEQERFYDIEVQLQESDEETDTCPSDCDDKDGQAVTSDLEYEPPESISLWSSSLSPLGDDSSDDVTCGRGWLQLLKALWTTMLPAQWVVVVAEGPELQLLQCSRLSLMTNTIVHIQSDLSFFITVEGRRLPDTHMLYQTHKWTITHIHQLVSLLLHLEGLVVCSGSSPTCHLLLTPPCLTCVPCLFQDAEDNASTDEGQDDNSSLI
ncbi:uncharacterized protein LOC115421925 [Sphaeramia orbicularis]|uniref:uncharacterized protein LOC115421925 n=1 Tax=Sphaeramia orbicularis TaxID=375764 RepID=UPI00117F57DC|nr:uncharacterized protein LOC115421925 [Sphaeramia orbicularis]